MTMSFGNWISTVRDHQEEVHGVDHLDLVCYPEKLTAYVQEHLENASRSVEHAMLILPRKDQEEEDQRKMWEEDRTLFVDEIAHSLKALGAVLAAVHCSDNKATKRLLALLAEELDKATTPDPEPEAEGPAVTQR